MIEPDRAIENEFPAVNFKYDLFICYGIHYQVGGARLIPSRMWTEIQNARQHRETESQMTR